MPAPTARTAGLVLVGIVHLLMVGALVKGFQRHVAEAPPPIQVRTIDPAPKPPEPVVVNHYEPPTVVTPKIVQVPIIEVDVQTQQPATVQTTTATEAREEPFVAGTGTKTEQPPVVKTAAKEPAAPGAICTQMAAPEMPAVNWNGEALFRAVAEVQGGRVVAVQVLAMGGAMDNRTRRAFSNAIEGTLKSRYVCPGEHRFQQDFAFRVD